MSPTKSLLGATAAISTAFAAPVAAHDASNYSRAIEAVQARMALVDEQDERIPGRVLVFAKAGEQPIVDVRGVSHVEKGTLVDGETPFYIASMTKAFVGLMALRLDRMGVMPLDMNLAEAYPDMRVEGVDLAKVTMRNALSHQLGFHSPLLSMRSAYTDQVASSDYAAVVNASQERTDSEFSYSNIGYILYAGALEKRTGRSWKAWLDELVLNPLGMRHSSPRTSDVPEASHTYEVYESGWRVYPPKTDDIMHAAGGLFVSGEDMARWLVANAGDASGIEKDVFEAAQHPLSKVTRGIGPMQCSGYALGWAVCDVAGVRVLEHSGTYTGARSEMIVMPDQGVGFAAMFNSDSMTGGLGAQLMLAFAAEMAGAGDQLPPPRTVATRYAEKADRYRRNRSQSEGGTAAHFVADPAALARYTGRYTNPAAGELRLALEAGELVGWVNEMELSLLPTAQNEFKASLRTSADADPFVINMGDEDRVTSIEWADIIFIPQ